MHSLQQLTLSGCCDVLCYAGCGQDDGCTGTHCVHCYVFLIMHLLQQLTLSGCFDVLCCALQAVRKMMDAKKLESTLNYDSDFKKSD